MTPYLSTPVHCTTCSKPLKTLSPQLRNNELTITLHYLTLVFEISPQTERQTHVWMDGQTDGETTAISQMAYVLLTDFNVFAEYNLPG